MKKETLNTVYTCPSVKVTLLGTRRPLCQSGLEDYKSGSDINFWATNSSNE